MVSSVFLFDYIVNTGYGHSNITFLLFHLIASNTTSDYVITNVQVVITRTLAEAEELGTALPRWFYFSYFNRYD